MRMFLRKPARAPEPLAVTMSGVRMGERLLQIGVDDPALTGALAARTGLSGHAAIAVTSEQAADRARSAAAEARRRSPTWWSRRSARLPFESGRLRRDRRARQRRGRSSRAGGRGAPAAGVIRSAVACCARVDASS